ncbi:hypothetical protein [Pedobacter sp.]
MSSYTELVVVICAEIADMCGWSMIYRRICAMSVMDHVATPMVPPLG